MTILITAATEFEMQAICEVAAPVLRLITGIGPVEAAFSLTSMLCGHATQISTVINFGIAGAYSDNLAELLDICLAEQEILGDLGLYLPKRIERLSERGLEVQDSFLLDHNLCSSAAHILAQMGISYKIGTFVTVSSSSGTPTRARLLGRQYQGLCENMEGAAVARVCKAFNLPCVELRCISNIAGERDKKKWQAQEACLKAGRAAAAVATFLSQAATSVRDRNNELG